MLVVAAILMTGLPGTDGRCMHLLTNVLDKTLLSDEPAEAIYRKRRGIELVYRPLKQTMGRRRMRCDAPANAAVELDWSVRLTHYRVTDVPEPTDQDHYRADEST